MAGARTPQGAIRALRKAGIEALGEILSRPVSWPWPGDCCHSLAPLLKFAKRQKCGTRHLSLTSVTRFEIFEAPEQFPQFWRAGLERDLKNRFGRVAGERPRQRMRVSSRPQRAFKFGA